MTAYIMRPHTFNSCLLVNHVLSEILILLQFFDITLFELHSNGLNILSWDRVIVEGKKKQRLPILMSLNGSA